MKLLLFFLDIGLTNSWGYYKLCNRELCNKEGAHADFFQALAESMVNTHSNWHEYQLHQPSRAPLSSTFLQSEMHHEESLGTTFLQSELRHEENSSNTCLTIHLNDLGANLLMKIEIRQVCKYELRKPKWKSVVLWRKHGVCLCLEVREQQKNGLPTIRKLMGLW